jgi:hypothetical protein
VANYYDALLTFLHTSVAGGLMSEWQMGLMETDTDIDTLLPRLVQHKINL